MAAPFEASFGALRLKGCTGLIHDLFLAPYKVSETEALTRGPRQKSGPAYVYCSEMLVMKSLSFL